MLSSLGSRETVVLLVDETVRHEVLCSRQRMPMISEFTEEPQGLVSASW